MVYTDDYASTRGPKKTGYNHRRIHYDEKVYVSRAIHTNASEGFWSLTKRETGGRYHAVAAKHRQEYLNEYAGRSNLRADGRAVFDATASGGRRSLRLGIRISAPFGVRCIFSIG